MPLRLPACEHAVLRHRSVGGVGELRSAQGVAPAAVGPLNRLERLEQDVDLCLILAGIQLAQKDDRQAVAVDVVIDGLPRLLARDSRSTGINRGLNLRIGLGLAALDEAQPDEALPAQPPVAGRLKILKSLVENRFDFRAVGRNGAKRVRRKVSNNNRCDDNRAA